MYVNSNLARIFRLRRFLLVATAASFNVVAGISHSAMAQALPATDVFMSAFHAPRIADAGVPETRANALTVLTNGVIERGGIDRIDTWNSDELGQTLDFVGLQYATPTRFDFIQIELGTQFADGGDWDSKPNIYILKDLTLVGDTVEPNMIDNWVPLPAASVLETTGHVFSPVVAAGSTGTMRFDLTGIPAANRTGWGWAVGGVDGNANTGAPPVFHFISLTEAWAEGQSGQAAPAIPAASLTPKPVNLVTNSLNSTGRTTDFLIPWRGQGFASVTNGTVDHAGANDGFDTWQNDTTGTLTDFVGLQYRSQYRFDTITAELAGQFADGGDWEVQPRVFILKNPVDTAGTRPESDPANWTEITGLTESTGHVFGPIVVPGPGGTVKFDLTSVPAALRSGYGWAIGGVDGNQRATDSLFNFISITELSATGQLVPEPSSLCLVALVACFAGARRQREAAIG